MSLSLWFYGFICLLLIQSIKQRGLLQFAYISTSFDNFQPVSLQSVGRNSSVGKANRYGLSRPGIERLVRMRFSAPVQTDCGTHPPSYTTSTGYFAGIKRPRAGVGHPPPHLAPSLKKEYRYTSTPPLSSWPVIEWTLPLPLPNFNYPITKPANSTTRIILSFLRVTTMNPPDYQVRFRTTHHVHKPNFRKN